MLDLPTMTGLSDMGLVPSARPPWVAKGASLHLDFAGGRAALAGKSRPISDLIDCGRASVGWAPNKAGQEFEFAAYEPRITDLGLLIRDAETVNGQMVAADRIMIKPEPLALIGGTGTWFIEFVVPPDFADGSHTLLAGTSSGWFYLHSFGERIRSYSYVNGKGHFYGNYVIGNRCKLVMVVTDTGVRSSMNGNEIVSSITDLTQSRVNSLGGLSNGSNPLNSTIQQVIYWPDELSDAQLRELTQ